MTSPTMVGAYLALFFSVGFIFLLVNLAVGWLVRPSDPTPEKLEIYECGEPTIGSSFVQFDLRFYVIALVFIVFDAEVAFLFPVATVFGKATNLTEAAANPSGGEAATGILHELGVADAGSIGGEALAATASGLGWMSLAAIMVFFIILIVGFAYEWQTGSLDWVKAASAEKAKKRFADAEKAAREPAMSV